MGKKREELKRKKILNKRLKEVKKAIKKTSKNKLNKIYFENMEGTIVSIFLRKKFNMVCIKYKFRNRVYIKLNL